MCVLACRHRVRRRIRDHHVPQVYRGLTFQNGPTLSPMRNHHGPLRNRLKKYEFGPLPFRRDIVLTCRAHDQCLRASRPRLVLRNLLGPEQVAYGQSNRPTRRKSTFRFPREARPTHLAGPRHRSLSSVGDADHLDVNTQTWNTSLRRCLRQLNTLCTKTQMFPHSGSASFGSRGDAVIRPWAGGTVPIRAPMGFGKIRRGGGSFRGVPRQSKLLPRA